MLCPDGSGIQGQVEASDVEVSVPSYERLMKVGAEMWFDQFFSACRSYQQTFVKAHMSAQKIYNIHSIAEIIQKNR